jgi:hypothetical protein
MNHSTGQVGQESVLLVVRREEGDTVAMGIIVRVA